MSVTSSWGKRPQFCVRGTTCWAHLPYSPRSDQGPQAWGGQQRPPLFWGDGRGPKTDNRDRPASPEVSWWQGQACNMTGPQQCCQEGAVSSRPAICQLPLPVLPWSCSVCPQGTGQARVGGASPEGTGVREGGLDGQVALSEPGGCLERTKQADGVTPKSPRAWLGATWSWSPPTAAPPHCPD